MGSAVISGVGGLRTALWMHSAGSRPARIDRRRPTGGMRQAQLSCKLWGPAVQHRAGF
jgi:hypothetical protein